MKRWLLTMLWLWPWVLEACSVPVFRYALERWPAEQYEVVVFYPEPLHTGQRALIEALRQTSTNALANLSVELVNLDNPLAEPKRALWQSQIKAQPPWVVVQYPPSLRADLSVWAGPLEAAEVKALVDSPARRELAQRLLAGDSAVWLLLECGDAARDQALAQMLADESRRLEKILKLPEAAPDDPKLQADLQLKIAFSVVRVARSNPLERMFVNLLQRLHPVLATEREPMMFTVYGRGRALPPMVGTNILAEYVTEAAEFVCGACSCEVKSMNPGFDLLLAADWDALIEGRVVKDPELPPLVGLTQFQSANTNPPLAAPVPAAAAPASAGQGRLTRRLFFVLGIGVVGVAAASLIFRQRRRGGNQ